MNGPAAELAIRFLREFADRTHHLKEERILFPAITAQGHFPSCGLIREHQEGRGRVSRMAHAAMRAMSGDEEATRLFTDIVNATFSRDGHEGLLEQFAEMERREVGAGAFERFSAMAQALETRYAPRNQARPSPDG